jgi:CheY-like chemotaxis protein
MIEDIRPYKQSRRLLLLDIKSTFRDVLGNSLNRLGWHVTTFSNAIDTIHAIETSRPNIIILAENKLKKTNEANPSQWVIDSLGSKAIGIPIIAMRPGALPENDDSNLANIFWAKPDVPDIEKILAAMDDSL